MPNTLDALADGFAVSGKENRMKRSIVGTIAAVTASALYCAVIGAAGATLAGEVQKAPPASVAPGGDGLLPLVNASRATSSTAAQKRAVALDPVLSLAAARVAADFDARHPLSHPQAAARLVVAPGEGADLLEITAPKKTLGDYYRAQLPPGQKGAYNLYDATLCYEPAGGITGKTGASLSAEAAWKAWQREPLAAPVHRSGSWHAMGGALFQGPTGARCAVALYARKASTPKTTTKT